MSPLVQKKQATSFHQGFTRPLATVKMAQLSSKPSKASVLKPSRNLHIIAVGVAGIACIASFFEAAHARTWTSVDGRKVEAEFVNAKGGKLLLLRDADRQGFALDLDKGKSFLLFVS